ncbi:hypothetical protein FKR81_24325 [Lentzea tibetensis]|uniref:Uncharacterized protein n=1 Tax=Lentzea tibetensis TaxID=2591470 RepID=A0A563EPE3_9PSEU|nr:hypothetical protein [Lentzea tibetensis]TWP49247.1 hypothetical protein FKR81_24325 [Lentzea tibetensis]
MKKFAIAIAAVTAGLVATIAPAASAAPADVEVFPKVLHSFGYENLLLGMNAQQAEETGLLRHVGSFFTCEYYELVPSEGPRQPNTTVTVQKDHGVVLINSTTEMTTTRGIHEGSTLDEVRKAYPDARPHHVFPWIWVADAPLNHDAQYKFNVSNNVVDRVQLQDDAETNC